MNSDAQAVIKSDKWWYRILQVLYIVLILSSSILLYVIVSENTPTVNGSDSRYSFVCDDGRQNGNFTGSILTYDDSDYLLAQTREIARFACSRPDFASTTELIVAYRDVPTKPKSGLLYSDPTLKNNAEVIPSLKNYHIERMETVYYGSWGETIGQAIRGFIILVIVLLLIRATALYILFKEPFLKNLRVWQHRRKLNL